MGKYMQKVMKREKMEIERECGDLPFGEYLSLPEDIEKAKKCLNSNGFRISPTLSDKVLIRFH